MIIGA